MSNIELVELFVNLIKQGRECEIQKQLINDKPNFEPYATFTRIDRFQKNIINQEDLINFLKDSNLIITKNNLKSVILFMEYYDRNFDTNLNFEEFLNFILPKSNSFIRAESTQRETFKIKHNESLSKDLEQMISNLLMKEFKLFEYADKKKVEIFMKEKLNLLDVFLELDYDKDGFINQNDIDHFLRNQNVILYNEEVEALISVFDEDLDGKLNWNEFLFLMLPSKMSYDYDYTELREMENEHMNIYYDLLRREKIKKEEKIFYQNSVHNYSHNNLNEDKINSKIINTSVNNSNLNISAEVKNKEENFQTQNFSIENNIKHVDYNLTKDFSPIKIHNNYKISPINYSDSFTRDYTHEPDYKNYEYDSNFSFFINEIYNLLKILKEIENVKIQLSYKETFNLINIFKFFDVFQNDVISLENFITGLDYFNIMNNFTTEDIELVFMKFDKLNKGKLK